MYCLRNRDSPGITANPPPQKKNPLLSLFAFFQCRKGGRHPSVNRTASAGGTKARADFTHTVIHVDTLSPTVELFPRSSLN